MTLDLNLTKGLEVGGKEGAWSRGEDCPGSGKNRDDSTGH
jgi:hypothetical protein